MSQNADSERTATVSMANLLRIQKGLLDVSNYAAGVRGGWVDPSSDARWDEICHTFQAADSLLRSLMKEAESGSEST